MNQKLDDAAGFTKSMALTQVTDTRNTLGGGQESVWNKFFAAQTGFELLPLLLPRLPER